MPRHFLRCHFFRSLAIAAVVAFLCTAGLAQGDPTGAPPETSGEGRQAQHDFNGVGGQITAIEGSTLTLQTFRGATAKVKVTPSTRVVKDRIDAKLSDFQIGDRVFVAGDQGKDGVWTAQLLAKRTDAGGPRNGRGMQFKPEDNGRTYIAGELIKVDGTKLTIRKLDNSEQVIEVDDDTSFRNQQRENVTLADLKIGEFVRGPGVMRDGVFFAKELGVGRPHGPRFGAPPKTAPGGMMQDQLPPAPQSGTEKR